MTVEEEQYSALLDLIDAALYKAHQISDELAVYILGMASLHVSQSLETTAAAASSLRSENAVHDPDVCHDPGVCR